MIDQGLFSTSPLIKRISSSKPNQSFTTGMEVRKSRQWRREGRPDGDEDNVVNVVK
ncbi:hypothetical protein TSUD_55190 [Trifolium subterraneum]|uniref:Uncharacterized protein n=1 Tax=Trifolium subterraneum TaxID=3900 RepID=A0A2Z6M5N3_TRISU|nr:hypothetical protein TSUD_55190 [Trifolium subterraneum]